jgi:hypothetical protein
MEADDLLCLRNARHQKDVRERPGDLLARGTRALGRARSTAAVGSMWVLFPKEERQVSFE